MPEEPEAPQTDAGAAASGTGEPAAGAPAPAVDFEAMLETMTARELEELHTKAAERDLYLDHLKRKTAEFENLVKRSERERSEWARYAGQKALAAILPLKDGVEQSVEGLGHVLRQIEKTLADAGVKPIEAVGEKFDPALHEAVMQEESDTDPDLTVLSEFAKGYRLHDRVLRPSKVKVSRKPVRPAAVAPDLDRDLVAEPEFQEPSTPEAAAQGGEEGPERRE